MRPVLAASLALALLFAGCGDDHDHDDTKHAAAEHGEDEGAEEHAAHGHANDTRHGGRMAEIGDHAAWVEIVHDRAAGTLTAYVYDAHVQNAARLAQKTLRVEVTAPDLQETFSLTPVADELTGEKPGDASKFTVTDERLKELAAGWKGAVGPITLAGATFPAAPFVYRAK